MKFIFNYLQLIFGKNNYTLSQLYDPAITLLKSK